MSSNPPASFDQLPLNPAVINNLASLGYQLMTPVQAQSLPLLLAGEDIIAQAKTGSGKTVAFGLPVLHHLTPAHFAIQALILCPTRELAEQVSQTLRKLARLMPNIKILNLSGGIPMRPQTDSLQHGAHIIVGTPGRILKHLDKGTLILPHLRSLVLDEADRMLDMGFYDDIKTIISRCPPKKQTMLFSATYPAEIKKISQDFMKDPKQIIIESQQNELDIEQHFYEIHSASEKFSLLKTLLLHYKPTSTLIFCNKKQQTFEVVDALNHAGFNAMALNGDMEQIERDQVIIQFVNQSCSILVATDVAARGLDINELPAVINYDLAFDPDTHIHRIGRTGRAGKEGRAFTMVLTSEAPRVCLIEAQLSHPLTWKKIDSLSITDTSIPEPEMMTLQLDAGRKDKIRPGDILGALTKDAGFSADTIGKIDITALYSYIAVKRIDATAVHRYFKQGKLKNKKVNARLL